MNSRAITRLIALWLVAAPATFGANRLFFFELQGIVGYSSLMDEVIFYSLMEDEVMQKPSIGFDYIQRLSRAGGDFGVIAVQARAAYSEESGDSKVELQLYNASIKLKSRSLDYWFGHSRPALGLSSYFDSHGLLLETLAMHGFGFDRDWGAGLQKILPWGDLGLSVTSGSGMPLHLKGNYLLSARVSKGLLNQQNYNWGFSAAFGEPLETMGYELMDDAPYQSLLLGTDLSHFWNNLENRVEIFAGRKHSQEAYALFWRGSINLLSEGRLKLEIQPMYLKEGRQGNFQISFGVSFAATGTTTLRAAYTFDDLTDEQRFVIQWYYYRKI